MLTVFFIQLDKKKLLRLFKFIVQMFFPLMLVSCTSYVKRVPIIERSVFLGKEASILSLSNLDFLPEGMIRVEKGDSLYQIALKTGCNWRDLMQWNNLSDPNYISPGQFLYIVSPESISSNNRAIESQSSQNSTENVKAEDNFIASAPVKNKTNSISNVKFSNSFQTKDHFSIAGFIWPAKGEVKKTIKGIEIRGNEGDAILAAAAGKVLYAGSGLKSYGHLIVLKHPNSWLTAYGHNKKLLVQEGDEVLRGQKIAEMGNSGHHDRNIKLYFEVRRIDEENHSSAVENKKGMIVDPLSVLPKLN